MKKSTFFYF